MSRGKQFIFGIVGLLLGILPLFVVGRRWSYLFTGDSLVESLLVMFQSFALSDYLLSICGLAILLIGLPGLFIWRLGNKPFIHKSISQKDFRRFLETLLDRGYHQGFLAIDEPRGERFIQIGKYINGPGQMGLRSDFPLATWSVNYFEPLKKQLEKNGISFLTYKTGNGPVSEFVIIDFGQDVDLAMKYCEIVIENVFGMERDAPFDLQFSNVSLKDDQIGF